MNEQNKNGALVIALVVLGVLVLLAVLSVPAMMGMMGVWGGVGMMGGGYWWGWLVMLVVLVLILGGGALLIAWFLRQGNVGGSASGGYTNKYSDQVGGRPGEGGQTALDILNQRYARGEITKEAYDQMKRDILAD